MAARMVWAFICRLLVSLTHEQAGTGHARSYARQQQSVSEKM
jgi:hypothetical protein